MTDWTGQSYLDALSEEPGARAPASLSEIWNAEWASAGLDTITGVGQPYLDAENELRDAISAAAGKSVGDYAFEQNINLGAAVTREQGQQALTALAATLPEDKQKEIAPLLDLRRRAAEKAQTIERNAADVSAATYGLSGTATAFLAGVARQAIDPGNLGAMLLTAPAGGVEGGALATIAREAAAGGIAQAAVEPVIEPARGELGLEHGAGRAFQNIVGAAAGGAAIAGGTIGLGFLFRRGAAALRARHAQPPASDATPLSAEWDGTRTFTGYMDPEEADFIFAHSAPSPEPTLADLPDFETGNFDFQRGAAARPTRERIPPAPVGPWEPSFTGYLGHDDAAWLDNLAPPSPPPPLDRTPGLGSAAAEIEGGFGFSAADLEAAAALAERDHLFDHAAAVPDAASLAAHQARVDHAAEAMEAGRPIEAAPSEPAPAPAAALAPPPPPLVGTDVPALPVHRVVAADGRNVEVKPIVVEASSLIASSDAGFDASLQPRQRERAASAAQIRSIAARLDPERLGRSAEADRGAPIIGPEGMVESGNGRVLAIREAYRQGGESAQRYRDFIAGHGVDVSGFKEPVLVRQRVTELSPEERRAFTVAANQSAMLAMSASERALADARLIGTEDLARLRDARDLGALANRDFVRGFVAKLPQAEQGALADKAGRLSSEGLTRVRNAVLARAYGDAPALARIAEATSDDVKSISNALIEAAPVWAKLRADIAEGVVRADMDVTPALMQAVERTADLRAKGTKLADYLNQQDAFETIPPEVEDFMRMFYDEGGRRAAAAERIAAGLNFYAQEARKVSAAPGLALDLKPVSPGDLQRLAIERSRDGKQRSAADLFAAGEAGNGAREPAGGQTLQGQRSGGSREGAGSGSAERDRGAAAGGSVAPAGTDPAAALDAQRAIEDAGGDFSIILPDENGNPRSVSAAQAMREADDDARAAAEFRDCIGDSQGVGE